MIQPATYLRSTLGHILLLRPLSDEVCVRAVDGEAEEMA